MAKFTFPVSQDQFEKALSGDKVTIARILGIEVGTVGAFLYGCIKQGWYNKQYRKDIQQRDQDEFRIIKQKMQADPNLRAKLLGTEQSKGVK